MKRHRLASVNSGYPGRQADQSPIGRITRAKRISPCGVHLGRHREQSPCERAQRTGRWHGGVAGLAAVRSLTATAPVLW